MVKKELHTGFTLIELLLVIGIIGVLSSIVIVAVNPEKQLCDVHNATRSVHAREIEKAMMQYMIGEASMPGGDDVPLGVENAKSICRTGVSDPSCVNLDDLVPEYIAGIPVDDTEVSLVHTGFSVYLDSGSRQQVEALNMEECVEASTEESSSSESSILFGYGSASSEPAAAPSSSSSSSVATSSSSAPASSTSSSSAPASSSSSSSSSVATSSSSAPASSTSSSSSAPASSSSSSSILFGYGP